MAKYFNYINAAQWYLGKHSCPLGSFGSSMCFLWLHITRTCALRRLRHWRLIYAQRRCWFSKRRRGVQIFGVIGEHPVPENLLIWDLPPWLRSQSLACPSATPATGGVFSSQVADGFQIFFHSSRQWYNMNKTLYKKPWFATNYRMIKKHV